MTGCPGNYQYYRQPPTNFTNCNPVRTIFILTCTILVPHDSTTVTVDWYWSKNINECGRNITEEQGRFIITSSRKIYITNVDRIITDLTIMSPQTDTGYYWCQISDPSYNGVFISSNKAPVFDTETMTTCDNVKQSTIKSTCAVGSVPPSQCVMSTKTVTFSPTTNYELNYITTTAIPVLSTTTIPSIPPHFASTTNTGAIITVLTSTRPTETLKIKDFSQLTYMSSTMSLSYYTTSVISLGSCCNNEGLISGLVVLSIVMFCLGGVLGGLLTVLWNKWRSRKGICHLQIFNNYYNSLDGKNLSRKETRSENCYFIK